MPRIAESWVGHTWAGAPAVSPRVVSAQYCQRPSWGLTGRHVHALWVLDYARTDCGLVRVGSPRAAWRKRSARSAHLYAPGTPFWEDTRSMRGALREAWVIFAAPPEARLEGLLDRRHRFARIADPGGRLDAPLRRMAEAGQALGARGFWRAQAALAEVLDLLHTADAADGRELLLPAAEADEAEKDFVDAVMEYFQGRLADRMTLADAAARFHMSPSAFSHRFAREAGQSPMAARMALRIECAKSLLLRGLTIQSVARQTGFFDAFHFSRTFKRHCGVSPRGFRRAAGRAGTGRTTTASGAGAAGPLADGAGPSGATAARGARPRGRGRRRGCGPPAGRRAGRRAGRTAGPRRGTR